MPVKWTSSEESILREYYGRIPVRLIQSQHLPHRTLKSVLIKASNMGLESPLRGSSPRSPNKMNPTYLPQTDNLRDLWSAVTDLQQASLRLETSVANPSLTIKASSPIIVGFLADAHIGAMNCKYSELEERFSLMSNNPHFYLFSVGDSIDNYLPQPHGSGMFDQLIPPALQKQLVEDLYMRMKGRWLGVVEGCHDNWSYTAGQFDWNKYLSSKLQCPNLGFGATVNLTVGSVPYRIMLKHKYRFNSSINLTHTVKRMREMQGDFDIGCVAHHHQAAIEQAIMGDGVDRIFIRPGSFKGSDRFSSQLGFTDSGAFIPSVVLDDKSRKMTAFLHLEQAVSYMESLQ